MRGGGSTLVVAARAPVGGEAGDGHSRRPFIYPPPCGEGRRGAPGWGRRPRTRRADGRRNGGSPPQPAGPRPSTGLPRSHVPPRRSASPHPRKGEGRNGAGADRGSTLPLAGRVGAKRRGGVAGRERAARTGVATVEAYPTPPAYGRRPACLGVTCLLGVRLRLTPTRGRVEVAPARVGDLPSPSWGGSARSAGVGSPAASAPRGRASRLWKPTPPRRPSAVDPPHEGEGRSGAGAGQGSTLPLVGRVGAERRGGVAGRERAAWTAVATVEAYPTPPACGRRPSPRGGG
ncbi:hypothetical protein OHA_1_01483 [Pleomorphomonas sp. SM30]|nr:hypothetical protein OHA_1_01483 [Pleomorphomonas sp. SM30]